MQRFCQCLAGLQGLYTANKQLLICHVVWKLHIWSQDVRENSYKIHKKDIYFPSYGEIRKADEAICSSAVPQCGASTHNASRSLVFATQVMQL